MGEQAYQVTLRRARAGRLLGGVVVDDVVTGVTMWLDLHSKAQLTEQMADLIRRAHGNPDHIEAYRLEVADRVTGDVLTTIRPSLRDLEAIRDGSHVQGPTFKLADVSDAALLQELARRLLRQ